MNEVWEKILSCERQIRNRTGFVPRVALVLGSGLGGYTGQIKVDTVVDYGDIQGFPVSTAPGHEGRFVFGHVGDTPVVCMKGRVHYYEGYEASDVVLPLRVMKVMGASTLFITNASGGINPDFKAGDLMMIKDQISFLVPSPLRGANISELGVRFPDMSSIYSPGLRELARKKAVELGIDLKEGVYVQTKGPQYETPAEINACRIMGADAVGMSTGIEAIAANHAGMKVLGISCVSNMAAGISPRPLSEEEVIEAAERASDRFSQLVTGIIKEL